MSTQSAYAGIARHFVIAVLVIVGSGAAGWWLANLTAPRHEVAQNPPTGAKPTKETPIAETPVAQVYTPPDPPVYLYVNTLPGGDREVTGEEIRMAAAAGIHDHILSTPVPWKPGDIEQVTGLIDWAVSIDPRSHILLEVVLDPPVGWLTEHPDESILDDDAALPYASPSSTLWRKGVNDALTSLAEALAPKDAIRGYVFAALVDGNWMGTATRDRSPANLNGFRQWLTQRYLTDEGLRDAWQDDKATLTDAAIPAPAAGETEDGEPLFSLAELDFLRYTSESRADAIIRFTDTLKAEDEGRSVWARYGLALSAPGPESGQFALAQLLESAIDGILYPAAAIDRGLGGVGGCAGPVDSILAHDKACILLDDTYTGLAKNPETGAIERMRGLNIDSVANIQQRNFASALTKGLGIAWCDPKGDGRLHDDELWEQFGKMRSIYSKWYATSHTYETSFAAAGSAFPPGGPALAVIVDVWCRTEILTQVQQNIIASATSAALRSGVEVQFWLLEDLLAGRVPNVPVYLFANPFQLAEEEIARIHSLLQENRAAAIWMYAPGIAGEEPNAEAASTVTGLGVHLLNEPTTSGSRYVLDSHWIGSDERFGDPAAPAPVFFIDDENADVLAQYEADDKASAALATAEGEWASIFVAEPVLPFGLLRELLQLLDVPSVSRDFDVASGAVYYLGPHLLAIHPASGGAHTLDFYGAFDVVDLFEPDLGWLSKSSLKLELAQYETRLLLLTPTATIPDIGSDILDAASQAASPDETSSDAAPDEVVGDGE